MGKQPPKPPGANFGVIDGGKAPKKKKNVSGTGARTTFERWKAMETWWLKTDRNIREFARVFGISERQAHRIVHQGVRSRGLPPLLERAAEHDALTKKTDITVTEAQLKLEASEWSKTKRANLTAIRNTRALLALVQNELVQRFQAPRPFAGQTDSQLRGHLGLVRVMAQALKDLGDEERRWIHGVAPEEPGADKDSPFLQLTPDQVAYIEETGRIPPGVDPQVVDDFFRRLGLPTGTGSNPTG